MHRVPVISSLSKALARTSIERRHLSELIVVAIGQFAVMLAALATLKIFTWALSPADYGQLNLLLVAIILPSWLIFAPLTQAVTRWYAAQREIGQLDTLGSTVIFAYVVITAGLVLLFLLAILTGLLNHFRVSKVALSLVFALFLLEGWVALGLSVASAARERSRVAGTMAISAWLRLALAVGGISLIGPVAEVIVGAYVAGSSLVLLCAIGPLLRGFRGVSRVKCSWPLLKSMLIYGAPFGLWSLFAWGQQYFDRYVVNYLLGSSVAGTYIAAVQITSLPFGLAGTLVAQFITPIVYEKAGDGRDAARMGVAKTIVLRAVGLLSICGLAVVVLFASSGGWIMNLFANDRYVLSPSLLAILAGGALVSMCAQQLTLLFLAHNRPLMLLWSKVIPGVIAMPLVVVLTNAFGLCGAVTGYFSSGFIFLVLMFVLIKRIA